jgi:hypothetical protein
VLGGQVRAVALEHGCAEAGDGDVARILRCAGYWFHRD